MRNFFVAGKKGFQAGEGSRVRRALRVSVCMGAMLLALAPGTVRAAAPEMWVATWGTSQLQPSGNEVMPPHTFDHTTLRQVVHVSTGGSRLRLRLSNAFGQEALEIAAVRVAKSSGKGGVVEGSSRAVTFSGRGAVSVPMGSEYVSDALAMDVAPLSNLVIDLEIASAPAAVTLHTGARATSFLASGSHAGEAALTPVQTFTRWYFLAGVEVAKQTANAGVVVAFGDSITDGHGATTDGNDRWTDVLARRLAADAKTRDLGVVNAGIGGNHLLYDGLGPNALARFDRDVLARPGVRYVLLLEGINDLGGLDRLADHGPEVHAAWLQQVEAAMAQMVLRAHDHGIKVIGGTLTPYVGSDYYHPKAASEADRVALNAWIRESHTFDAVVDFDAAVRDPASPERMLPAADSGDHLHPGPEGYRRMGEEVPLALFAR